jgi:hypothetical protein
MYSLLFHFQKIIPEWEKLLIRTSLLTPGNESLAQLAQCWHLLWHQLNPYIMIKSLPITLLALLIACTTYSQVISNFTWESGSVTQAVSGPNAISVGSSAVVSTYGTTGKGLNPGNPKMDVDLVLPGSPYFDVPGIDFSVSFRREETQASFIKRGNQFDFGMDGGNLSVKFSVSNGSGGSTNVNASNIYSVPNDHAFHIYRFIYNSNTGIGQVLVDGAVIYTYTGTAGRSLYWISAGDVVIGSQMDATGDNVAVLDNMLIQVVPVSGALPLKLLSFTAQPQSNGVALSWVTTQEEQMSHLILERSADGINYSPLTTLLPKGNYAATTTYNFTDANPLSPVGYYRLKMVDLDGAFTHSAVRTASFGSGIGTASISCFPNPATDHLTVSINNVTAAQYRYTLVGLNGMVQQTNTVALARGTQQVTLSLKKNMAPGMYMLQLENISSGTRQAFTIVKQ